MTGTGTNIALLTLSNGPSFNYGSVVVGSSLDQSFTLTNTGVATATSLAASALSAPFSFKGGTFPVPGKLQQLGANNQTCQIVVTFTPVAATTSSSALTVAITTGQQSERVGYTGGNRRHASIARLLRSVAFQLWHGDYPKLPRAIPSPLTNSGASTATSLSASRA